MCYAFTDREAIGIIIHDFKDGYCRKVVICKQALPEKAGTIILRKK